MVKIWREPKPEPVDDWIDDWNPDKRQMPVLPDKPEEDNRDLEEIKQSLLHPVRETPTRAIQAEAVQERLEKDEGTTLYKDLDKIYERSMEGAKSEEDVKKIKMAFHKFADEHPIKSEPYWTLWMNKMLKKEKLQKDKPMTAFLKMWPQLPDVMNGIDHYQWEHPIDVKKKHVIVRIKKDKNGKKRGEIVEYKSAAFQSDAMFGETIAKRIKLSRGRLNGYINVLKEWGWLEWMEDTGRYHNIPVYASGYYSYYKNEDNKIVPKNNHLMTKELWYKKIKELKGRVD